MTTLSSASDVERAAWRAPLARPPSELALTRSRVLRRVAEVLVPPSILVSRAPSERKRIALTFDDGPDAMTPRYLDVLDELGVRATFFVVGESAERAPEQIVEYMRRGHEVAGHGFSHEEFTGLTTAQLIDEIVRTRRLLPEASSRMVRPPRGALSVRTLAQLAALGERTVLWSIDSDDCRTRDPAQVAERVRPERTRTGDIVLMHESQPWTLEALPSIVGRLRDAGYELTTVGALMNGVKGMESATP